MNATGGESGAAPKEQAVMRISQAKRHLSDTSLESANECLATQGVTFLNTDHLYPVHSLSALWNSVDKVRIVERREGNSQVTGQRQQSVGETELALSFFV